MQKLIAFILLSILSYSAAQAQADQNSKDTEQFIEAACKGDLQQLAILYATSSELDVNASASVSGRTALTCATENARVEIIKTLAKLKGTDKVDFNKTDRNGADWISLAVKSPSNLIELLRAAAPVTNFDLIRIQGYAFLEWPGWYDDSKNLIEAFPFVAPFLTPAQLNKKDLSGKSFVVRLFLGLRDIDGDAHDRRVTTTTQVLMSLLLRADIDLSYFEINKINLLAAFFVPSKVDFKFGNKYLDFLLNSPRLLKLCNPNAFDSATGQSLALAIYKNNRDSLHYFLTKLKPSAESLKLQNSEGLALCNYNINDPVISESLQKLDGLTDECAAMLSSMKGLQLSNINLSQQPELFEFESDFDRRYFAPAFDVSRDRLTFLTDGGWYFYDLVVYDLSQNPAKLLYKKLHFKLKVPSEKVPVDVRWNSKIPMYDASEFWVLQNGDLILHQRVMGTSNRDQITYVDVKSGTETLIKEKMAHYPYGFAAFSVYGDNTEKNVIYYGLMKSAHDQPISITASERIFDIVCANESLCSFSSPVRDTDKSIIYQINLPDFSLTKLNEVSGYTELMNRAMPSNEVSKTSIAYGTNDSLSNDLDTVSFIIYDSVSANYVVSNKTLPKKSGDAFLTGTDKYVIKTPPSNRHFPNLYYFTVMSGAPHDDSVVCRIPNFFYSPYSAPDEKFSLNDKNFMGFDPRTQVVTILKGKSVLKFKCE